MRKLDDSFNIGATIRELRRARNMTGEELAQKTGISQSKISKIETGFIANPKPNEVEQILTILDAPQTIRQRLLKQHKSELGHLHPFDYQFPFKQVADHQARATHIRVFCISLLPALLQTHSYRETMHHYSHLPEDLIKLSLKTTFARQDMLWDKRRRYHFIVAESSLYTRVGDKTVQLAQLDRIDRFIGSRQNVRVGILPYQAGFVPKDLCTFALYDNTLLYKGVGSGDMQFADTESIEFYLNIFGSLERLTDYGDAAHTLVHKAMDYFS